MLVSRCSWTIVVRLFRLLTRPPERYVTLRCLLQSWEPVATPMPKPHGASPLLIGPVLMSEHSPTPVPFLIVSFQIIYCQVSPRPVDMNLASMPPIRKWQPITARLLFPPEFVNHETSPRLKLVSSLYSDLSLPVYATTPSSVWQRQMLPSEKDWSF